jgi:hypothetical protein
MTPPEIPLCPYCDRVLDTEGRCDCGNAPVPPDLDSPTDFYPEEPTR